MGRDTSKGKGKGGGGRGGGQRMFIANVEELAIRDREVAEHLDARSKRRAGSDEESGDEKDSSDDEEENETEKVDSVFAFDRTKAALPNEDASHAKGPSSVNPNHAKKPVEKMIKVKNVNDVAPAADPEVGGNRKEREAIAAVKAKEDYQKRHMAGETEQAKQDLARLAVVKARREADAKKREAEGRKPGMSAQGIESSDDDSDDDKPKGPKKVAAVAKPAAPVAPATTAAVASAALAAKKKAAAAAEPEDAKEADGGPPKLKAMDIKKLNGDALKDHLKERGLDVQGQKKDLMKRLTDYEAARA